jgi:Flp pilus assembly protein TadG
MIGRPALRVSLLRCLFGDRSGVTLVEFAIVGPVLILMIMGLFDISHSQYTSSVLQGALQKAGRDLTLQNGASNQTAIDNFMIGQVKAVMPNNAQVTVEKESFFDFSDVGRAEQIVNDANNNGVCNTGETYIDANNSGSWNASRGRSGLGGARDVVLYTATVTYPRLFPMAGLAGLPSDVTLKSSTVLRNQPFNTQAGRNTTVRNC